MKTLTRIKDYESGEEYYIGKIGNSTTVIVTLFGDDTVDWTNKKVTYTDVTASKTVAVELDENHACKFDIEFGHTYKVQLPTISGYPTPVVQQYTAVKQPDTNYITYTYTRKTIETVTIYAYMVNTTGETVAILQDLELTCQTTSMGTLTTKFNAAGNATFAIPYGDRYTITYPTLEDYTHNNLEEQVAGLPQRTFIVHYIANDAGVFAIASDGLHYNEDDLSAMTADQRSALNIVAIGFANSTLANATRGDGTTGCNFCIAFEDKSAIVSRSYLNVERSLPPDLLPYVNNSTMGDQGYNADGKYLTQLINQVIADETQDESGVWTTKIGTYTKNADGTYTFTAPDLEYCPHTAPAAAYCAGKAHPISGELNAGFLPSYAQIQQLAYNYESLHNIYSLLGKTAPTVTSGYWWTSCQTSETDAVHLYNGGFYGFTKTYSTSVLVCFDL